MEFTDAQGMFALDSDPEVHKYLGNNPVKTIQEVESAIDLIRKQYIKNGFGRCAVIDKVTNEFLGWGGIKYEENFRPNFAYNDIGYRFRQEFWGKGIATEVATASLKWGFETLKLKEICGTADVENLASNKVLNKIGLNFKEVVFYEETPCNWYTINEQEYIIK
jgi:ribosomal-protein-alanine N-acetyltransferase